MRVRWTTFPVVAVATLALSATAAFGATIMVDSDGAATPQSCNAGKPGSAYTTIQAGVNAASPGDRVKVCGAPSPYAGATVTTPNVALVGVNHPVVQDGGTAITLGGNNDSIKGFEISNSATGITTQPTASGYVIQRNDIHDNGIGIYLQNGGANQALVAHNRIANNNNPANPSSTGTGIYSDGTLVNALITGNTFDGNSNEQINVTPTGPSPDSGITITRNTFVHALNTDVALCPGCGSAVNNSTISFNRITDQAQNSRSSIYIGGPSTSDNVTSNKITNSNCNGVAVRDTASNIGITGNTIATPSCHGIDVSSTAAGAVNASGNIVTNAGDVGINLGAGTNANHLTSNRSSNSKVNTNNPNGFNCVDANGPTTTNVWSNNHFAPSSPAGICN